MHRESSYKQSSIIQAELGFNEFIILEDFHSLRASSVGYIGIDRQDEVDRIVRLVQREGSNIVIKAEKLLTYYACHRNTDG